MSAIDRSERLWLASRVLGSLGTAPLVVLVAAIVFGTGEVTRSQMLRAGSVLDVVFVFVTTGVLLVLAVAVLPGMV